VGASPPPTKRHLRQRIGFGCGTGPAGGGRRCQHSARLVVGKRRRKSTRGPCIVARPRPTPRPPHSRSARLSPSLDAAPDTPVPPAPHPHPSARFLTASLLMAQDGSGSQGDRGGDARLRPGAAGSRGGRPHFAHPGCAARAPREQRLSDLCAPNARSIVKPGMTS
jgi:hypothetical protein